MGNSVNHKQLPIHYVWCRLQIHLLAGRCLRSTSSRMEPVRDLYCVLECDRAHKARTVIRTGDVNFDWDETFDLDLVVNRELDFLIYSWDPQLRHRLCFKGSLHLVPLLRESPLHQVRICAVSWVATK